jgi:tetratricopeptide (TPR) repeat protein
MHQHATGSGGEPHGRSFGPLAEALRKRGALSEALRVVLEGLSREPGHLPGQLVLSRIRMDQQDWDGAEVALRAALTIDPSHPGVLEGMADLADATGRKEEARAWREALMESHPATESVAPVSPPPSLGGQEMPVDAELAEEPDDFMLTESLAALYRRQGHLEKAIEVYDALARRSPHNEALSARREALRAEFEGSRPRPYDSAVSGGPSVRNWLAGVAAAVPLQAPPGKTGYDAFFEPPTFPARPSADFEAFQAWLKGLGR